LLVDTGCEARAPLPHSEEEQTNPRFFSASEH
jgi:hypothetical protein